LNYRLEFAAGGGLLSRGRHCGFTFVFRWNCFSMP